MELNWLKLLKRKMAFAHSPQLPKQQKIAQHHNKRQKRQASVAQMQE